MTAVLPVAASLPGPADSSPIGSVAAERSTSEPGAPQFNHLVELAAEASAGHPASSSASSWEVIGSALNNYVGRMRRHEEAQKAFSERAAAAVEESQQNESASHRGPAHTTLEPPQTEPSQSGREPVTLDTLRAAEAASLEAMSFMFDTSLLVGTMTEVSRSFNTLLKAQ